MNTLTICFLLEESVLECHLIIKPTLISFIISSALPAVPVVLTYVPPQPPLREITCGPMISRPSEQLKMTGS